MSGERTTLRPPAAAASMFGRGPMGGLGMPVQKALDIAAQVALGLAAGMAGLTRLDLLDPTDPRRLDRPREIRVLLAPTSLAGIPIVAVSAVSGEGLDALRAGLAALRERDQTGEGMEGIDGIEDIAVGDTPTLTVSLDAGNCVFICNIYDKAEQEAHYQEGMRVAFTVE